MKTTCEDLLAELKNRVYHPVYFLYGDEPYFIDLISDYIEEHVLSGVEKEFNQSVVYGREVDLLGLISMARRYPMMSNYQVLIVKEAQDIKDLMPKKNDKHESPLLAYLEHPQPSTLLVLCHKHKAVDKRTRFAKALERHTAFFESAKLHDNKIPGWVSAYVKKQGYRIREEACVLLAEHTGNDLTRIVHELEKLFLNTSASEYIDNALIEKHIGISKEFNVFELQKALGSKDILQANRIINYMAANTKNNPVVLTFGSLHAYFNKLMMYHTLSVKSDRQAATALGVAPFFMKEYSLAARNYKPGKLIEIFSLLRECDVRSKGVDNDSIDHGDLVKELVYKILH